VRPAAGRNIKVLNLDNANSALTHGWLTKTESFEIVAFSKVSENWAIIENHALGKSFRPADFILGNACAVEVDRTRRGSQMEGDRAKTGGVFEGLRQDVLTGVLLHVVAAASAIDAPKNRLAGGL
jgi:hypothetical protein